MESIIRKLERIIVNFRKAGTRRYQKSTLIIKLEETELLRREFLDLVNRKEIKTDEAENITKVFEKYYKKAKNLLVIALNEQESDQTQKFSKYS